MSRLKQRLVLAIYPCSKGFGYCLFESPEKPLDFGVKVVRKRAKSKALQWCDQLMDYFEPYIVVLRKVNEDANSSKRVLKLIGAIQEIAHEKGLQVFEYDRTQIKNVFEQFGSSTKYTIAKRIQEWIPEFAIMPTKKRKAWETESYYAPVFDVASLAVTHYFLTDT